MRAWKEFLDGLVVLAELGAMAFDVLYSMINGEQPQERQLVLPVQVMYRASCGCPVPASAPSFTQTFSDPSAPAPAAHRIG